MTTARYARVKELFQAVVKMDPSEWDTYLERECGKDSALRGQVQELLRHHRDETVLDLPGVEPRPRTRFTFPRGKGDSGSEYRLGVRRHRLVSMAILVLTLSLFGLGVRQLLVITERYEQSLHNALQEIVGLNAELLERWAISKERKLSWVKAHELRAEVDALVAAHREGGDSVSGKKSEQGAKLRQVVAALAPDGAGTQYLLVSMDGQVLAASKQREFLVGGRYSPRGAELIEETREGPAILPPFRLDDLIRVWPADVPVPEVVGYADRLYPVEQSMTELDREAAVASAMMIICEPISDRFWEGAAARVDAIDADVYAFNDRGVMISRSRYEDTAEVAALLGGLKGSALNLTLRDPGQLLTKGSVPGLEEQGRWPLTEIVRRARASAESEGPFSGVELDGYRSYRGLDSIGAWEWIDSLDIGVVVEAERKLALTHVRSTERIAALLLLMLLLLALAALYSSLAAERLFSKAEAGMELGQYRLLREIGEGGLGRVFLARHSRLRRLAAVKLIKHELLNEETVLRFEREVQLTCELSHPNTLVVYDYGRSESGTFYYAMEYLPGVTLAELIKAEAPLPVGRAIYILRQLLSSLAEAHGIGMVHRDVKPLNVMINHMGGEYDLVKVLDFGLAKEAHGDDLDLTSDGMVSGTPLYIAPERFLGEGELDPRSDLYSVGTIAYQLLTGQVPFDAPTRMELLLKVQNLAAPRVSEIEGVQVPSVLDELIQAAMAKLPEDRPSSAAEMASLLEELQRDYPWSQAEAKACWASREASGAGGKEAGDPRTPRPRG